jgi:hypothetical protein
MANIVKSNNFTTTPQIDWLSLRILYLDNILKLGAGYDYKIMPYSTRTFKRVIEITDLNLNEVVATITDSPTSPTINENLILIKFHNKLLYQSDLKQYITNFCQQNNFKIVGISRLDIAIDFTSFANNLHPEIFIKRFLKGSYIKKGRGNFKTNFKTREYNTIDTQANGKYGKTIIHEYLRFGSANNGLKYYLYNKSKELEQVKEKPYIRERWREFGHDEKKDVWRLEFSLTSSKIEFIETSESQPIKKDKSKIFSSDSDIIDIQTGEEIKIKKQKLKSLDCLELEVLEKINASLINKYMVFYLNKKTGTVKDRAKKITLIKNLSKHIAYTCDDSLKDSTNTDKNFITNLRRTYEDLRHKDVYSLHTLEKLIFAQIQKRGLQKWADDRQILNFDEGNPYQYKGSNDEIKAFKRPKDLTDKAEKAKKFNKDD